MLGLPKSTEFNKRIPKQKFYDHLNVRLALRRRFIDQIKSVYWANKIAAATVNLDTGRAVTEIEVFRVQLSEKQLDESVLLQIDREIPYHILFVLEYEDRFQAWIGYKEVSGSSQTAFKVSRYYHTDWMVESELPIKIEGLNLDAVYENFVRQIAGGVLKADAPGESLKASVERDVRREKLQKQIDKLSAKMRKEKQLNRKMEMNEELKKLKKELEELND